MILRIKVCRKRILAYTSGDIDSLSELESEVLDWFGNRTEYDKNSCPTINSWSKIVSASVV